MSSRTRKRQRRRERRSWKSRGNRAEGRRLLLCSSALPLRSGMVYSENRVYSETGRMAKGECGVGCRLGEERRGNKGAMINHLERADIQDATQVGCQSPLHRTLTP
ncbi:hypothetical protein Ddc_10725 [Ditylenchus destructor]|nr:hypothetical protein Ddc_10725 [Ditylenchus destructor]